MGKRIVKDIAGESGVKSKPIRASYIVCHRLLLYK